MTKWTLLLAGAFRKIFAPALLVLIPPHSTLWFAVLVLLVIAGTIDVFDTVKRAIILRRLS